MTRPVLPCFADFCDALAIELEDSLDVETPEPDLHDVFARARVIDAASIVPGLCPDVDPALVLEAVDQLSPRDKLDELDAPAPELALFGDAVRGELAATGDAAASPVPPSHGPTAPARSGWSRVAAVGLLAAAAVAAIWVVPWRPLLGQEDPGAETRGVEAHMQDDDPPREDPFVPRTPRRAVRSYPEIAAETEPETEPERQPEVTPEAGRKRPARRTAGELERRARQAWEAGELERAEGLFRSVIARSGGSNAAELAYGDLFAIARHRGGRSALAKVWREYLRTFPKGRYADDARGGLCRATQDDAMQACWTRYLADFPDGAHALHARAALVTKASP